MNVKLCPFCHSWLSENIFDDHVAQHTKLLPDGQMTDHITVPPEQRHQGDIAKEPKWYVHPKCGGVTGMPEDIIRSYLADPFLYNESSFCTGCGTYVPTTELFWQETNDSLHAASCRRKAEYIKQNHLNPDDFVWDAYGPVQRKSSGGGGGWGVAVIAVGGVAALFLLGFVFLFGVVALRAAARPAPKPAFPAGIAGDFPRHDFPDIEIPKVEFPKGPDFGEINRKRLEGQMESMRRRAEESRERMTKQQQEITERLERSSEELKQRLNSSPLGTSPDFDSQELFGPPNVPGLEAGQGSEAARQRAQERIDAVRERIRSIP